MKIQSLSGNVIPGNNFKALHLSDYIQNFVNPILGGNRILEMPRGVNITFLSIADPIKYREAFDSIQVEKILSA